MHVQAVPDTLEKLATVGDATRFEPAGDQPVRELRRQTQSRDLADCVMEVATPAGRKPILKSMLTTACERNCFYCPFRAGRTRTPRVSFTPDEMAAGFHRLHQAGRVDGLFLSSGILRGSRTTQDRLLDTAEMVRGRYGYRGYLHLKIMPGIEREQLYRAMQLATRVSVNLEGTSDARLQALAPKKDWSGELLRMLEWTAAIRREHPEERLARAVTQFVVGPAGESDAELLQVSAGLYQRLGLSRVYYSAFEPVVQTPFENEPAADPIREHRLYQASFLLRDYGWGVGDLAFGADGNLPTEVDPKRAWAEQNLRYAPVDVATAGRAELMRVPGVGPRTADAILAARREHRLTDLSQLGRLGLRAPEQAAPFILIGGRRPATQASFL